MKRFIFITIAMLIMAGQVFAASKLNVEVFDKNGKTVTISKGEMESLESRLPSVRKIIASLKESALGGGDNLYIEFQLQDGTWKETGTQINWPYPISWYIRNMIKDELK